MGGSSPGECLKFQALPVRRVMVQFTKLGDIKEKEGLWGKVIHSPGIL